MGKVFGQWPGMNRLLNRTLNFIHFMVWCLESWVVVVNDSKWFWLLFVFHSKCETFSIQTFYSHSDALQQIYHSTQFGCLSSLKAQILMIQISISLKCWLNVHSDNLIIIYLLLLLFNERAILGSYIIIIFILIMYLVFMEVKFHFSLLLSPSLDESINNNKCPKQQRPIHWFNFDIQQL